MFFPLIPYKVTFPTDDEEQNHSQNSTVKKEPRLRTSLGEDEVFKESLVDLPRTADSKDVELQLLSPCDTGRILDPISVYEVSGIL